MDYQNRIPRSVAAAHMGYASLNGKSLGVLSALIKFGLLEGRADDTRVSDDAVTIIAHPPGSPERVAALREAAARPDLYSELDKRFGAGKASDQAVRSFLMTQKFIPAAADAAIRGYRETKQLVEGEAGGYSAEMAASETGLSNSLAGPTGPTGPGPFLQEPHPTFGPNLPAGPYPAPPTRFDTSRSPLSDPYRISFTQSGGIEIVGRLSTSEDAADLIQKLEALKSFLRPYVPPSGSNQQKTSLISAGTSKPHGDDDEASH